MTIRVKIDHIGAQGDGVAQGPDGQIFIPYSMDGEAVEIKLHGKQGTIKHIDVRSPSRIEPVCKHFGRCGGCSLQHVSPDYYVNWKKAQIRTALSHRGFQDVTILEPVISPLASRRRVRLNAIGRGQGKIEIGFSEKASHNIIDVTECPVLAPALMNFIAPLRKFLSGQLVKRQKMAVQINLCDNGLDIILETGGEPDLDMRMDIAGFAEAQDVARICWLDTKLKNPSNELLCERRKPFVTFDGHKVFCPPGSFLQATKEGEAALISQMKKILGSADKIIDIFAGSGTFTIALISDHAVHAVEGSREMVEAIKISANQMVGMRNLTTEVRDLFIRPIHTHELMGFDAVVIDPPRAGARDQIMEIANSEVKKIVMVSCNPATFARDARSLVDAGFIMGDILPIDQFLYSPHLEVIAGFDRRV